MHKNFYGYQKGNVETLYTVEYIDDLLEKENEQYRAFLKEYHAEETFKNWKKEH